ncbi:hypothetical protein E2C01_003602 [Portunus trituberculatus]|uniref:Uncharacterized protein n=1 Tax=Portunus trituberculatus TaxID=210409 RepID=A0A5B7CMV1_PORTR|nr:hypothetical protein [Portunus trituberculatus]
MHQLQDIHQFTVKDSESQVSGIKKRYASEDKSTKGRSPKGHDSSMLYGQKNRLHSDLGIGVHGMGGICPKVSHPE